MSISFPIFFQTSESVKTAISKFQSLRCKKSEFGYFYITVIVSGDERFHCNAIGLDRVVVRGFRFNGP